MGANAFTFKTDDGGNLLHFAVECSSHFRVSWECDRDTSLCLRELLKTITLVVDEADDHGKQHSQGFHYELRMGKWPEEQK